MVPIQLSSAFKIAPWVIGVCIDMPTVSSKFFICHFEHCPSLSCRYLKLLRRLYMMLGDSRSLWWHRRSIFCSCYNSVQLLWDLVQLLYYVLHVLNHFGTATLNLLLPQLPYLTLFYGKLIRNVQTCPSRAMLFLITPSTSQWLCRIASSHSQIRLGGRSLINIEFPSA